MKESQGSMVMQKAEVFQRRALTLQLAGSKLPKVSEGAKENDGFGNREVKGDLDEGCFNGVVGMESI